MRIRLKTSSLTAALLACSVSFMAIGQESDLPEEPMVNEHNDVVMSSEPNSSITVTADNWCSTRDQFEYGIKGDGFVGFQLKKGTLTGNVERFIGEFYPNSNGFISKVGRHLVPGDHCLVAKNPDELMQAIIEPYYVGSVPIYYGVFTNHFHALFYKDDPEFIRYRLGVRK